MARILQHMAVLIFVCLGETVAGSVISRHRSPGRNAIPLDWMGDLEADCYVFSRGTDVIRVTDEDGDRVLERLQILWVSTFNNYYSERKHNGYNITESVYAIKSRHNDLLYWVDIIKSDGTRSDDLVLWLQCRPGIKVNGHHKALYRKIKWTNSVHLYLSFSLKSYEDNGYLWTDTDGARENVFVTGFCKTFGLENPPGYEEKRGEIFYQRSGDERVDLNKPHPEKPKSEKDRGGVDKPWDPIASLGVISLLLVTIYRCSPGTKVTNITKCKVAKVKGQHGGVVIAGDYATVNFHYHYANRQD
ncbi:unnamed protein product [Porites evermanni]|uniref:Uncharacterized protein n=1 Tax=Porites evermanni TaxID=104178 RepID=A0ABN8RQE0_9CNID|nr:unnamed protein product [Porites evermanni]